MCSPGRGHIRTAGLTFLAADLAWLRCRSQLFAVCCGQQPSHLPSVLPAKRSQWRDRECPAIRNYRAFSCAAGVLGSSCWHRDVGHEAAKREVGVFTSQVPWRAHGSLESCFPSTHPSGLQSSTPERVRCATPPVSHLSRSQRWPGLEFVLSLASLKSIWQGPGKGQLLQSWPAVAPPSCKPPVALLLLKVSRRRLTASLPRHKISNQAKTTTENESPWELGCPYVRRKACPFPLHGPEDGSLY